jgi:hypothetical protein
MFLYFQLEKRKDFTLDLSNVIVRGHSIGKLTPDIREENAGASL